MNNQKIIKLETKIKEMQKMFNNYKSEMTKYENTISKLVQQVAELKNLENNKKNIK